MGKKRSKNENADVSNTTDDGRKRKHVESTEDPISEVFKPKKVKKKKKHDEDEEDQIKTEEVHEVTSDVIGKKSKKKKKNKNKEETVDMEDESGTKINKDSVEEVPKKKKREKVKKDRTLEAFENLKKSKGEAEDDDDGENEDGDQPKSKKKVKKVKKVDHVHETKGQNRALIYLEAWNSAQNGDSGSGWKFEKCRQIWLLANVYNSDRIPDSKFDTLLKYMDSIKGKSREAALGM